MKKKLLYLTSILLFSAAVSNAQNVVRTWIFPSPSTSPFPSVGVAYTSETTINGLTLVPGASITTFGVCDGSNTNATTFTDGAIFSGRIKFGGGGIGATPALVQADYLSPTANFMPNQRYLSFPVAAGSTTVKVWFKTSTGGTPKSVICTDGISFKAFVTTVGSTPGPAVDGAILTANYSGVAGKLYLFSDLGSNIYQIEVTGPDPALAVNNFQKESPIVVSARNGKINLSNVKSSTKVSVYNVLGSLVKSIQADADTSLDINSGVYIVKTKSVNGEKSVKVIVQ